MAVEQTTEVISTIPPLWILIIVAIIIALCVVGLAYIDYLKKKNKPETKPDPITKSFFVCKSGREMESAGLQR